MEGLITLIYILSDRFSHFRLVWQLVTLNPSNRMHA